MSANDEPGNASEIASPLWDSMRRVSEHLVPGASTVPYMTAGATDARFFRRAGVTAYGYGLFSDRISFQDFTAMFHGDDERIDRESLELSTNLWLELAREFLDGPTS